MIERKNTSVPNLSALAQINEQAYKKHLSEKIQFYQPHPKQALFHANPAYCRVILGGNRGGKTKSIVAEAIAYAQGRRQWDGTITRHPPSKVLIGCQNFLHSAKTEVCPTLEALLPEDEIAKVDYVHSGIAGCYTLKNGSIIAIYSYRQEDNSVEGGDWDFVACNEPPPEWFVTGLERGLIDRGGRIVFAMTPLSEPWISDKILDRCGKDPDYWSIFISQDDNPHLGEEEKRRFRAKLSKEEAEARIFGRPRYLMGRVYKDYSLDVHLIDRDKYFADLIKNEEDFAKYPKGLSIDPHDKKPFAMIWFAINPRNQMIIFDEWPNSPYYDYRDQHHLGDYARIIGEKEAKIPGGEGSIKWRFLDPRFGRTPSVVSGKNMEDDFVDYGLLFETRYTDSIEVGHMAVREKLAKGNLGQPSLFILNNCQNTHDAMMRYSHDEKGEGVREEFKDFADALRYAVVPDPQWVDPKEEYDRRNRMIQRLKSARRTYR